MPRTHVRRLSATVAAAAAAVTCTAPAARGGLTTRFAVHEGVNAFLAFGSGTTQYAFLDATVLPVHQTITATSGSGRPGDVFATTTSTYDVTDGGNTAAYDFVSQGQLAGSGITGGGSSSVGSGLSDSTATQFVLSAPATFVATLTATGPITTGASARLDAVGGLEPVEVFYLGQRTAAIATGTLAAGVPYTLYDSFQLYNGGQGGPTGNGSGTYAFTLTMTAVPEPTTAGLLAALAAGSLARRRRT